MMSQMRSGKVQNMQQSLSAYNDAWNKFEFIMDREGFEPSISPMPRAYPTSLDDTAK